MHRHLKHRTGVTPLTLITGGAGWKVAPHLQIEHEGVEGLIFDGLLAMQAQREAGVPTGQSRAFAPGQ